jgi:hypothetical protein
MKVRVSPLTAIGLLVLVAIIMCLLAIGIVEFSPDDDNSAGEVEWTPKLASAPGDAPSAKPINIYGEILAHPVFFMTREPFVASPPPPPVVPQQSAAPPPVDPGLILGGVMIGYDYKKAYLFRKSDPQGTWVNEGENFAGWTVQSVNANAVLLKQQDRTIELQLYPQP